MFEFGESVKKGEISIGLMQFNFVKNEAHRFFPHKNLLFPEPSEC